MRMDAHEQRKENISERSGELMDELLRRAVIEGRIETLKFRIVQRRFDLNARDAKGHTPLMLAARNGRAAICRMLVQHGVDIHATLNGKTALDMAHENGMKNVVAAICEAAGAEISDEVAFVEYSIQEDTYDASEKGSDSSAKESVSIKAESGQKRAGNIRIANVDLDALSDFGSFANGEETDSRAQINSAPDEETGTGEEETQSELHVGVQTKESALERGGSDFSYDAQPVSPPEEAARVGDTVESVESLFIYNPEAFERRPRTDWIASLETAFGVIKSGEIVPASASRRCPKGSPRNGVTWNSCSVAIYWAAVDVGAIMPTEKAVAARTCSIFTKEQVIFSWQQAKPCPGALPDYVASGKEAERTSALIHWLTTQNGITDKYNKLDGHGEDTEKQQHNDALESDLDDFEPETNEPLPQSDDTLKSEAQSVQSAISKHVPQTDEADFDWGDTSEFSTLASAETENVKIYASNHKDKGEDWRQVLQNIRTQVQGNGTHIGARYGETLVTPRQFLYSAARQGRIPFPALQELALLACGQHGHEGGERFTGRVQAIINSLPDMDGEDGSASVDWQHLIGRKNLLKFCLAQGVSVNTRDADGHTLLILAASAGYAEICNYLLENCADPHETYSGKTALMFAREAGNYHVVRVLRSALLAAHSPTGAQTEEKVSNVPNNTLGNLREVVSAISQGKEAVVRDFLEKQGYVNARDASGYTLLMLAAYGNRPRICRLLLEYGADPKAKHEGETALDIARKSSAALAANAIREVMRAKPRKASAPADNAVVPRLSHTVEVNKSGSMDTRLHQVVVGSGGKEEAELLLRHLVARGVDVNARDDDGYTPLMLAAKGNMDSICRVLVDNGADVLAERAGMTALKLAQESGANESFRTIREFMLKTIMLRKKHEIERDGGPPRAKAPAVGYSRTAALRCDLENIERYMSGKEAFPNNMRAFPALLADIQVRGIFNNVQAAARVHVVMTFCQNEKTIEHTVSSSTAYRISRGDLPNNQKKLHLLAQQFTSWLLIHAVVRNANTGMVFPLLERRPPANRLPPPIETKPSNVPPLLALEGAHGEMDLSLRQAALSGNETLLLECLPRCVDLNVRDAGGYTALMLAAKCNHAGVCRLLIRHGADISALRKGKTALDIAQNASAIEAEIVIQSAIKK